MKGRANRPDESRPFVRSESDDGEAESCNESCTFVSRVEEDTTNHNNTLALSSCMKAKTYLT